MNKVIRYSIMLCILGIPTLFSGKLQAQPIMSDKLPQGAYISLNPLSPTAFIPSTITQEALPYIHNLESGISLAGGYFYPRMNLEGKVVVGSPASLIFCPQIHAGIRYFPFTNRENQVFPLGFGFYIRSWDTYYTHSKTHFFNLSPHPNISYIVKLNRFFFDFRVGWDFSVFTWSNLEHSSSRMALTGFPPTGSIYIGYNF